MHDEDIKNAKLNQNANYFFASSSNNWINNVSQNTFNFDTEQRYRLVLRYKVCGNITTDASFSNALSQSVITNDAYLIGDKITFANAFNKSKYPEMPGTIADVTGLGWCFGCNLCNCINTPLPLTSCACNATLAQGFKFKCEVYGCKFYFASTAVNTEAEYHNNASNCSADLSTKVTSSIANPADDCFAFEVRPSVFSVDDWSHSNLSPAYGLITSGSLAPRMATWDFNGNYSQLIPASFVNAPPILKIERGNNNGTNQFFDKIKVADETYTVGTTPAHFDQRSTIVYFANFNQNSCTPVNPTHIYSAVDLSCTFIDNNTNSTCTTIQAMPSQTIALYPEDRWIAKAPSLLLNVFDVVTIANSNQVQWTFKITNSGPSTAPYIYIDLPPNMLPYFNNFAISNLQLNGSTWPYQPCAVNGNVIVFDLHDANSLLHGLETLDEVTGTIQANYFNCFPNTLQLKFAARWTCTANSSIVCDDAAESTCYVQSIKPNVFTNITTISQTFTLCSEQNIATVRFYNLTDDGILFPTNLIFDFTNVPQGVFNITSCIVSDCVGNSVTLPVINNAIANMGDFINFLNTNNLLAADGSLKKNACLEVSYEYSIGCTSLNPLKPPFITLGFTLFCQSVYNVSATIPPIDINSSDPSHCTDCYSIQKDISAPTAEIGEIITYTVTVTGYNGANATNVDLTDNLPPNFSPTSPNPFPVNNINLQYGSSPLIYTLTGYFTQSGNHDNVAQLSNGIQDNALVTVPLDCYAAIQPFTIGVNSSSINYVSNAAIASGIANNTDMKINGKLVIDPASNYFYIQGKDIKMGHAAEIIVKPGKALIIGKNAANNKPTKITACYKMWKGIHLLYSKTLNGSFLSIDHSEVNDAQYAINIEDYCFVSLTNSTFDRNYVSLYIPIPANAAVDQINTSVYFIDHCIFDGSAPLTVNYQQQTPVAMAKPLAGILAYRANINNCVNNVFNKLSNGIIGYNSNLELRDNRFFDIKPNNTEYADHTKGIFDVVYNGSAVYAFGGRSNNFVHLNGLGNTITTFDNCNYGLFADRINIEAQHNKMVNMRTGFRVTAGKGKDMRIRLNDVTSDMDGIQLYINDGCNSLIVNQNVVTFGGNSNSTAIGIVLKEAGLPNKNVHIRKNNIFFKAGATNARIGILSNANYGAEIAKNEITMTDATINTYGIAIDGSRTNNVSCNIVTGAGTTGTGIPAAVKMINGDAHTVGCNNLSSVENGLLVQSPIAGLSVKGNDFANNKNGLRFGLQTGSAKIINDYNDGNRFLSNTLDAWNEYFAGQQTYPKTIVDNSNNCLPLVQSPTNWFQDFPGTNWTCGTGNMSYCSHYPDDCSNCRTALDDDVATGEFENGAYTTESLWLLSKKLFAKLTENDILRNDSLMEAFYQSNLNTDLADLVAVEDDKSQLNMSDSADIWQLDQKRDTIKQTNDVVNLSLEAIYANMTDTAAIDSLIQLIVQLQNKLYITMAEGDSLQTEEEATDELDAAIIKTDNDAIASSNDIADYEQLFNEIYLSTVGRHNYNINSYQKQILYTIANLCPIAFGDVVFKARTLYSIIECNAEYNDMSACNAIGIPIRKGKLKIEKIEKIKLFPNPASDEATILFNNKPNQNVVLRITNVFGQIILEKNIGQSQLFKFGTQDYATGVYHIALLLEEQNIFNENLIIIRK
ncbi:MAG: DUF11 domain-containing protein [Bacteroidetes bacterium]|nr:DUF11 domain-containing protein [Bacteroidota bacterium]